MVLIEIRVCRISLGLNREPKCARVSTLRRPKVTNRVVLVAPPLSVGVVKCCSTRAVMSNLI